LFTAVCAGHQRFTFSKMINLLRYVLRIGLVLAILNAGGGAVILVAMDTALSLIVLILNAFYSIQALGARFNLRSLNIQLIRGVLSFSAWVFLFAIIGQVQWQSGQIIIGRIDGPESVAVYGIGIMFGTYYGAFSTALTGLFLARATYMTVSNANSEELCAEMQRIGRIALIILLLIVGGFACFGREFLLLWAGPDYGPSWGVAMVIMLAYTVPLVQSFANQLLEAKGLFKFKAKVYLVALPLGVVVGYFLFRSLGLLGMAVGMAAGWLAAVLIMNIYYHKVLHLDIPQFFVGISKGVAPTFLACMVIGGLLRMVPVPGWFGLFIQVSFFIVFYCLLMYSFGMNSFERQEAKSIVERFRWNRV
jgi:O-antigen/teichoic acid export membrane protein